MITLIHLAFLAAAAQPAGTTPHVYKVVPVTEEQAAQEFARTCLISALEATKLESVIANVGDYQSEAPGMGGLRKNWKSPRSEIGFVSSIPNRPDLPLPQCNITLFTASVTDLGAFRQAMNDALFRELGIPAQHRVGKFGETWWWQGVDGRKFQVSRILMGEDSQQIELTLRPGEPQ